MATYDEADGVYLRYRSLGASSVQLKIEEDKTQDSETNHATEVVGCRTAVRCPAIQRSGTLTAQAAGIAELAYTQVYTYDAIGNLTAKSDVGSYTYPASGPDSVRPHAVTETSNGWAFAYDLNGNMITRTVTEGTYQLSYTWENKLAAITDTTSMAVTRYTYDADGVLVQKVSGDQTTHYVNGGYEELRVGSIAADQLRHGPPGAQDRSNAASSSSAVITGCRKDRNRSMAALSDRAWCSSA